MDDFLHKNGILKMKKSCVALLTIAILSLGGCGGEDNKKDVAGQNNQTETETPVTPTTPTTPETPSDQAGGDTKQPDPKPIKNISEAIKRLEDLGEIPKLNKDKDIAGPDENGNGVRDDLDAYVASLPDKEEQKKAAIQYLAAYQYAITIDFENSQEVDDAITKTMDATSCIFERYGADEAMKITKNLETYLFNTRARFEAEQMFDIAQQWKVIESKEKGYCTK